VSGLDADPSSPFCYAVSYGYTEQLLAESGCPVSIASEFFIGFLARSRASGQLRLPAADGRISLVSRADVARCLAAGEWGTPLEYAGITPVEHCVEMALAGEDPWWMYA
jgi:NAD(P)H dehydrogenase (quinone)